MAILQSQEAKKVREIGSLIFETPIQHDYGVGVEVRSLLSPEDLEEVDGRLAVVDVDSSANRFVKFWVGGPPGIPMEERTATPAVEENVEARSSQQFQAMVPPFPLFTERTVDIEHREHQKEERDMQLDLLVLLMGKPGFGMGASATQR